ncbi:PPK2 family polyphosphate kinase [Pseudactinotalea suaedae]|uniref:PPK2 family polyphosphate kinase n=1 Tax=Pseudactinotalea suaedae TaxID=1524924 RepID=UPI0012E246CC|nr:PPK2 family polyphosphate kinase [Pseudactinotalea suaedae]
MGKKRTKAAAGAWTADPVELLRVGQDFDLASFDRAGTPGWEGDKHSAAAFMAERGEQLSDLQERLFADGKSGGTRSVLLLLQGIDTSGKGGIVRHVIGMVDPQGVALASFGVPTAEEREHDHLWRIRRQLPPAGKIGVFDRSHYEQVLVVKVDQLEPPELNETRYEELVAFDREIIGNGTTLIKVAMMVSHAEQGARLQERLERPDKWWKYNPGDVDVRQRWDAYQDAYAEMFARTSVDEAPWHVIPADRKWYARLAVTELLHRALTELELGWPPADFDPKVELERLAATSRA